MERKIGWRSCELDEIELVYDKAESNERIGKLLEELETLALSEAKNNCGLLTTDAGGRITPEQFESLICNLCGFYRIYSVHSCNWTFGCGMEWNIWKTVDRCRRWG